MKLTVTGRHVDVTAPIRAQIERKLAPLDRLLNDHLLSAQCVIARDGKLFLCDLTARARGDNVLHAIGRDARLDVAVAAAMARTQQQARRLADRWKTRRKDGATAAAAESPTPAPGPKARAGGGGPRIVRGPAYSRRPMSVDDAALALSASPREFIAFRDAATGDVAVLYRRPDGRYGLVEPEA